MCGPSDPDGNLFLMGIVENVRGITILPELLRQVKGIGAIWAGNRGDLSVSMGLRGNSTHLDVEVGVQSSCRSATSWQACPIATISTARVETRLEQGFRIV